MALVSHTPHDEGTEGGLDREWILKIDWRQLPFLEALWLDFKCVNAVGRWEGVLLLRRETGRECAEQMEGLGLRKLVCMNVRFGP
jgi:hypothetical protein